MFFMTLSMYIWSAVRAYMVGGDEAISHDIFIPRQYFIGHLFFDQIIFEVNQFEITVSFPLLFLIRTE